MSSVAIDLKKFSIADAAIATMAADYLPLTIADVNDIQGADAVHKARMVVKNHRVDVEKTRKALKADALEYGRKVEAEERAKREAEEARLKAERDAEEAKIRAERAAEAERLRIEREKLDAERKAMEAERAKIAAEQAAERARQKAEQDKIDAENRRLADIEAARLRKIEDERIAAEAAERAKVETEKRIAREAAEKKAAEEAKEAARLKAEALRPDRDKLLAVAVAVRQVAVPATSTSEGRDAATWIADALADCDQKIQKIVDQFLPQS